jgi:hypothetical protein
VTLFTIRANLPVDPNTKRNHVNRYVPLVATAIKKGIGLKPNHFSHHRHFFYYFLANSISYASLDSLPQQSFSQPWLPHTRTYFRRPSQMKARFANLLRTTFSQTALCEDIPTPNTNEIMVFSSFQCSFSLPAYDFFFELLDHCKIELVHLNPNSILHFTVFVHLCEAFLGTPP